MTFENDFSEKVVLVTGGCGFIGSHLVERLLELNARVRVLGHYKSNGTAGYLQKYLDNPDLWGDQLEVQLGTVEDSSFVRNIVQGAEIMFHLAALIGIPYSYVAPEHYVNTNVKGTLNCLLAARDFQIERFVQVSTSECFGSAQYVPMDELHPLNAQSPYAATKVASDQLALSFGASFEMDVRVVRPFNTFGPRQSLRAVIPTIVAQLLGGADLSIGDIDTRRDFNYVSDTVDGMLRVGSLQARPGSLYVVGSGREHSISDVIQKTAQILGVEANIETDRARIRPAQSEVSRLLCDYSRASCDLGYEPRINFDEGLRRTIDWFRNARQERTNRYHV